VSGKRSVGAIGKALTLMGFCHRGLVHLWFTPSVALTLKIEDTMTPSEPTTFVSKLPKF